MMKNNFKINDRKLKFSYLLLILLVFTFSPQLHAQCVTMGDCDGDGVTDGVDLDSDNDGILDTVEFDLNCSAVFVPLSQTFDEDDPSGTINDIWSFGGVTATFDYALLGAATWAAGIQVKIMQLSVLTAIL